jgi:hypothetical protein
MKKPFYKNLNDEISQVIFDGVLDWWEPVEVYRNLHKGCYSIRQNGIVRCHCDEVQLTNVIFKVSQAGRRRVLETRKKNVHAVVVGSLPVSKMPNSAFCQPVRYNPYRFSSFVNAAENNVKIADYVKIGPCGILAHGLG